MVGRLVHGAIQVVGIAAPAWLGWSVASGGITGAFTGFILGAVFAMLWFGVYSPVDPETTRFGVFPVPGRVRLLLEIVLIIAGGSALWMVWSRAAGETFLTAAFIDFVVRYPRLITLYRGR
jgi:hypothetical protein